MENVVMIKDGKYNIRLKDVIFSLLELRFLCEDIFKVDENIIIEYILKHMNDDVPNFIHLAANIALDMEKNEKISDTQKLRENIVRMQVIKVYSENEYEKMLINFVDFIKKLEDKDIKGATSIKIPKNVIDYFENQLLVNILRQYIKIIFNNSSHSLVKKIKITTKTSDLLYNNLEYDTLKMLEKDMVKYFIYYHNLENLMEVSKFEDYLIITVKNPLFN